MDKRILTQETKLMLPCVFIIVVKAAVDIFGLLGNSTGMMLITIVAACFILFMGFGELIAFLAFCCPLYQGIPFNYLYPLIALMLIVRKKGAHKTYLYVAPLIFIAAEYLLSMNYLETIALYNLICYPIVLFLFFFLILDESEGVDFERVVKMYIFGVLTLMCILAAYQFSRYGITVFFSGTLRFASVRLEAGFSFADNLNNIACYFAVGIACQIVVCIRDSKDSVINYVILAVMMLLGVMTASRTLFVCALSAMFLFLFSMIFQKQGNRTKHILIAGVFILAVTWLLYTNVGILERVMTRFAQGSSAGRTRLDIIGYYFEYFMVSGWRIWFGTGMYAYKDIIQLPFSMHNGPQQVLIFYGIFGCILFLFYMWKGFRTARGGCKLGLSYYIPLLIAGMFLQTVQFLSVYKLMIPVIVCFYALRLGREDVKANRLGRDQSV